MDSKENIMKAEDSIIILSGMGAISIHEVQLAGKRITSVADFVHGQSDFVGNSFDT